MVGILIAATLAYPWQAFAILGIGYLGSIPFSIRNYRIQAASEANAIGDSESEAASQTSGEQKVVETEQQRKSGEKPSDLPVILKVNPNAQLGGFRFTNLGLVGAPKGCADNDVLGGPRAGTSWAYSLATGWVVIVPASIGFAALQKPTPEQPLGPFYPFKKPAEQDSDLARVAGASSWPTVDY